MRCRKAFEIDLAAFIGDRGASEYAAFRAHYPQCANCSAEVRAWTELHEQLQSGRGRLDVAHPSEELLLRFEEEPRGLPPDERQMLEQHLAECRPCRDELRALRSFDFTHLQAAPAAPRRSTRLLAAAFARRTRSLVLHPAFAYGLALLLLLPTLVTHLPAFRSTSDRAKPTAPADVRREMFALKSREVGGKEAGTIVASEEAVGRTAGHPGKAAADPRLIASLPSEFEDAPREEARGVVTRELHQPDMAVVEEDAETEPGRSQARRKEGGGLEAADMPTSSRAVGHGADYFSGAEGNRQLARQPSGVRPPRGVWAPDIASRRWRQLETATEEEDKAKAAPPTQQDWWVLTLQPDKQLEVTAAQLRKGLTLRIPRPAGTRDDAQMEVRVRSPDDTTELRKRLPAAGAAENREVQIPTAWLSRGRYRIDVYTTDVEPKQEPIRRFNLLVR